jgi:UPF0755 protein
MKKILIWTGVAVFSLAAIGAAGAYWVWQDMQLTLDQPISLPMHNATFEIERGATLKQVADRLHSKGWLKNSLYLRIEARRAQVASQVKAGLYDVADASTPRELLTQFVSGDVKVFRITFVEGATFREIRDVLTTTEDLVSTIEDRQNSWVAAQISASLTNVEGQLFPSTYYFSHGDTDIDVLRRAHARMQELLAVYWASRTPDLPYKTAQEALTMASIVEKETGQGNERATIAGVFVRRLQLNMKLQTDPTVIYGLGESFDGNLRRVDLESDTPYNTYTRTGLPPSPIAMPGEAAIRAALNPKVGKALYFVGKGDGSHEFSTNLEDHNAAVRRYQIMPARSRR